MNDMTVLFVDDDKHILSSIKRLLRKENYRVLIANSGEEGLALLETAKVQLVVSDQRMPDMEGTKFLQKVKELFPDTVRVILSGYADVGVIVDSINKGEIYRFMGKPWNDDELKFSIRQCLEHYKILQRNISLVEQTRLQNEKLKMLNENLEDMVESRTRSLQMSQEILEMLPVGVVGISTDAEIVYTNAEAGKILSTLTQLVPGTPASELLPEEVVAEVEKSLDGEADYCKVYFEWGEAEIHGSVVPLGENADRGCVLMINDK